MSVKYITCERCRKDLSKEEAIPHERDDFRPELIQEELGSTLNHVPSFTNRPSTEKGNKEEVTAGFYLCYNCNEKMLQTD